MPHTTDIYEQISDSGLSLGGDFEGFVHYVGGHDIGSIQIGWTGADATNGQFFPQGSNDKINWCNLVKTTQVETTSEPACNILYEITDVSFKWLRINYIANSVTAGSIDKILYYFKRRRN